MKSAQRRVSHLATCLSQPGTAAAHGTGLQSRDCAAGQNRTGPSICVVGAGVVGLAAALRLLEEIPGARVHIVASKFGTDTLSDGAGGLWMPYALGDMPGELIHRWGKATFDHYMQIYASKDAAAAGVMLMAGYELSSTRLPDEPPLWADIVPTYRRLSATEVKAYDPTGESVDGTGFTTIIAEGRLYMAWLLKQIDAAGGTWEKRTISSLDELHGYDAIINCTGLLAAQLTGDKEMYPIRGHVLRVKAPWVRSYVCKDKLTYIIPNTDTVVLGGTTQKGDWTTEPRAEDRDAILERCYAVLPSLRSATVLREWVGLRPGRPSIRLEAEPDRPYIVHNYGHGGSGLTLAWGCAADTVQLVQKALSTSR